MSTKPRIIVPGFIYHISSEGIKEFSIFGSDKLKSFFLQQLAKTIKKYPCNCLAFSITNNQYHLVIKSGQDSISIMMQQFNSIIAKNYNRIIGRNGVVFNLRFKALIVEDDKLLELIRFVNLEPVTRNECTMDQLDFYKWSAHSGLTGNINHQFLSTKQTLELLGGPNPIEKYRNFMANKKFDPQTREFLDHLLNAILGKQGFHKREAWVLGKPQFVKHVLQLDQCRRARIARHISENINFDIIQNQVTNLLNLPNEALFRQGQFDVRSTARELFVSVGKLRFDFSAAQMAKHLNTSQSAVSKMLSRFTSINNKDFLITTVIATIITEAKEMSTS